MYVVVTCPVMLAMLQFNFIAQMKRVAVPFLPADLDLVIWNLSWVKYLYMDAIKECKEPGNDERLLSAGHCVCSILVGSPDTLKSILEEAQKQMSALWKRLAGPNVFWVYTIYLHTHAHVVQLRKLCLRFHHSPCVKCGTAKSMVWKFFLFATSWLVIEGLRHHLLSRVVKTKTQK